MARGGLAERHDRGEGDGREDALDAHAPEGQGAFEQRLLAGDDQSLYIRAP